MRFLYLTFCTLAFFRITGADLAVMQTQAWVSMIYERADQGIDTAIKTTFSGEAPCERCLCLKEKRKEREESPENTLLSTDKIKLPLSQDKQYRELLFKVITHSPPLFQDEVPALVFSEVDTPPPKFV